MTVPLLILDIDGTVRFGKDQLGRFVNSVEDVQVFPTAVPHMRQWKSDGGRIVGVSNQGGVGLGLVGRQAVAAAMLETERQCVDGQGRPLFDVTTFCPHAPDGDCWCRKPAPGMVFDVLRRLQATHPGEIYPRSLALVVGDRDEDRQMAETLGVKFLDAETWRAASGAG